MNRTMDPRDPRLKRLSPAVARVTPFPQTPSPGRRQLTSSDDYQQFAVSSPYIQVIQPLCGHLRATESNMAAANVMSSQSNPVLPKSHVGFDSITNQIERKLLKRGFQFNVICVGQ